MRINVYSQELTKEVKRSAITFWIPNAMRFDKNDLAEVFAECQRLALETP